MIVYGDQRRRESATGKLDGIRTLLEQAGQGPRGIAAHARLVAALIEAGELAQGLLDACCDAAGGRDAASREGAAAMALATALARACARSWTAGFALERVDVDAALAGCAAATAPACIEVRQPEGYAFYALYPEAYLAAALPLARARWQVVGLRSIGTSLAAMVSVGLDAGPPCTVRPAGPPFDRQLPVASLPADDGRCLWAVVDEGPGLSGSSLAAVVRALRAQAVAPSRIHLFPGHARGPGPRASVRVRELWAQASSHHVGFDALVLQAREPAHRLHGWVEQLIGPLHGPLMDISGGRWRGAAGELRSEAPPAHPWQERRKFLARDQAGNSWLVKFIGLGSGARRSHVCARTLAQAGFCPAPAGVCHGFVVERWHGEMERLSPDRVSLPRSRSRWIERLQQYIAFRARSFPAPDLGGASLQALHDMGRSNSIEALGASWSQPWNRHADWPARLQARVRRIVTDNRMQVWEWLYSQRTILKTDAVDHHAGHDLVGCQDPAWDVAGAIVEFALSADEQARLLAGLAARGCAVDPGLLAFCLRSYPAFQLGHFRLAAEDAGNGAEKERLGAHAERYARCLSAQLCRSWD